MHCKLSINSVLTSNACEVTTSIVGEVWKSQSFPIKRCRRAHPSQQSGTTIFLPTTTHVLPEQINIGARCWWLRSCCCDTWWTNSDYGGTWLLGCVCVCLMCVFSTRAGALGSTTCAKWYYEARVFSSGGGETYINDIPLCTRFSYKRQISSIACIFLAKRRQRGAFHFSDYCN